MDETIEYSIFVEQKRRARLAAAAALEQRNDNEELELRQDLAGLAASSDKAAHEIPSSVDALGLAGGFSTVEIDIQAAPGQSWANWA